MKVARLHGMGDLRLDDEDLPLSQLDESLVRVTAVGLCGSDLHWFAEAGIGDARLRAPLVLGHEFAGVVEGGPLDGRRVAVDPAIPCRSCAQCLEGNPNLCPTVRFAGHGANDGGLREYVTWPTRLLVPLPESVSDRAGAVLEPLGVAIHAFDLGHVRVGASVVIVGCGPIGLLLLQVARASGAGSIIAVDPLAHRLKAATAYGADLAVSPDEARADGFAAAVGGGTDVAFEVAGEDDAVRTAMQAARPGARIVLAGIPAGDTTTFPAALARRKGLTLVLVRRMKGVYLRAIQLVQRGVVDADSLVTHRFPLDLAPEAFVSASARVGLKCIVEPRSSRSPGH
jgi:L-iditol 2-dehydrogenase